MLHCAALLLAGEGIHTAMMGGKAAAEAVLAMRGTGDFSKASCAQYERKWKALFGHDFYLSQKMADIVYRCVRCAQRAHYGSA